ncbi:coiled-coil domain-containing protein 151-like [Poecilia formosa]|uniref:coiled-coil domain-containing protein 151-like n=1 Tax=Poecilia formosa TaxID=48698 RepID=UPI0004444673|nr:PREDICTED: coiled-coil domain-containing protein 151-like [Poecilia formosa]
MLSFGPNVRLSLQEQKAELQDKIQLLECEGTAFYERSQSVIKKNHEIILQLRPANQKLHKELAQVEQHNLSKEKAISKLGQELLFRRRRLDALAHTTLKYQQRLDELRMEEERRNQDQSRTPASAVTWEFELEEDAMNFRMLENRLDKFQFKCKEAEKCRKINVKLKAQMQDEFRSYGAQIDNLEKELLKYRQELHNLEGLNMEAYISKTTTEAELHQLEEELLKEHKERESNIARLRQKADQRKVQTEKPDKKAQRTVLEADDLDSEAQQSTRIVPEEEKVNPIYEEILKNLKEATGVSDLQDVVEHFTSEKENCERLENLKKQNEEALEKLKEEKELLRQQFDKMKYSGEAKLSSEIKKLEECEQQLEVQLQRRDADAERLANNVKALGAIRAGVEHLAGKLQDISLTEVKPFKSSPTSDEFVLELLNQCGAKLWVLLEELEGKDMASVMKEIEEDEFYTTIEGRLPKTNTKVQLPYRPVKEIGKEEGEIREDELDIISRDALKRQSQLLIENNLSKKPWKK